MKAVAAQLPRQLAAPDPAIRFYLFYGPDEAGSRSLAQQLAAGLGNAEKVLLAGSMLKGDPSLLADEARSIGLFGGRRLLWVEPAGDEVLPAVEALLEAPAIECPAVLIAGALRKSSALLKLAEAHGQALAHVSYAPEGRDAERLVISMANAEGLRLDSGVAARLAAASANDRGMIAQELSKLALFVDAAPDRPREIGHDALDLISADYAEGDALRVGDHALTGDLATLVAELERLDGASTEVIPIIRAIQRRLLMLAPLRSRVDRGERIGDVVTSLGKALFWKDKPVVQKLLGRWSSAELAQLHELLARLELTVLRVRAPDQAALGEELVRIARSASRRR